MDAYEDSARLFKALMHPARLEILELLRDGEHCVCHLETALGYRQAYISQQLSVLRENGLIQDRREGWNVFYRVVQPQVFALLDVAVTMVGGKPGQRKAASGDCPCPHCTAAAQAAA